MLRYILRRRLKKLCHLRLRKPRRLSVQPHLQACLRVFRLENNDFTAGFGRFLRHKLFTAFPAFDFQDFARPDGINIFAAFFDPAHAKKFHLHFRCAFGIAVTELDHVLLAIFQACSRVFKISGASAGLARANCLAKSSGATGAATACKTVSMACIRFGI